MKLEWMGRNRELVRLLMKFVNLFLHYESKEGIAGKSGIALNSQQWQTLECIVEYEDENKNMNSMANLLGLQKSSFSKHVKLLESYKLVERYRHTDNNKEIILKPSKKGRNFYQERSKLLFESAFYEPFVILDKLSDENLAIVVDFMTKMVNGLEPENNKTRKLFKLQ